MANVKINNTVYTDKQKVKLVDSDDESQFVTFSIGGGGGDTSVNKVLYADGTDVYNMVQNDGGQAWVNMFPNYITITMANEVYAQQKTVIPNSAIYPLPSTVYFYEYGVSGSQKIDSALLNDYSRIGIFRVTASMIYFISYDKVTLQDTGVTIDIGGYTFYEAIVVEDGE